MCYVLRNGDVRFLLHLLCNSHEDHPQYKHHIEADRSHLVIDILVFVVDKF